MSIPDDSQPDDPQPSPDPGSVPAYMPLVNGCKDGLRALKPKPDGDPGYDQRTAYNAGYVLGYLLKAAAVALGAIYGVDVLNAGI